MKWKIDGCQGSHLRYRIGTILATFDLQFTLMLPTKFRVNWHLGFGEEAKNKFSRWMPLWPSWIFDLHDFNYFWSTSHPNASYQVSNQLAFPCRRNEKIDFQEGGHLGFPIGTILAFFDLQVTLLLPTKFRVNWLLGLGEKAKNGGHLGFMIGMILAIFYLQVTPMLPTKFRDNWPFGSEEAKNRFSWWLPWRPSWISNRHDFSYFWSTSHPDAS